MAVGIYFALQPYVGTEEIGWMCILGAAPFAACGFFTYHGMTAEQVLWAWFKSEILCPKRLVFKSDSYYYEAMQPAIRAGIKRKRGKPILFLDIRFNNCDIGIDVAKKLRKAGNTSLIILLTSLHSKAIEGYEIGAYRYIVKPIIKEKMYAVLDEAISSIRSNYRVILVKDMYNTVVVKIQQILYIYSNARKRCLVTLDGEIETWEQLKSIYAKLPQEQFAYAQKGFVVNYKMIKKLNKTGVELVNGENVPISRGMKNEFFANYFEFLGK